MSCRESVQGFSPVRAKSVSIGHKNNEGKSPRA